MPASVKVKLVGDWEEARRALGVAGAPFKAAMHRAVYAEGKFFERRIVKGIRDQAPAGKKFKPLSPLTLATRRDQGFGGTKALIRNSDLQNSIKTKKKGDTVFVGVHRSEVSSDGKRLVQIAAVHEFGSKPIVIKVTPKMRRYFFAMMARQGITPDPGKSTGGFRRGILIIKIPARPYISPVFEKWGDEKEVRERVLGRMAKSLGGQLGHLL